MIHHSMPGETGIAALPSLRGLTPSPIVLLTGMAPESTDSFEAVGKSKHFASSASAPGAAE